MAAGKGAVQNGRRAVQNFIVGIDFDNTIVSYDALAHAMAVEQELVPASFSPQKEKLRDEIRARHGDEEWQKIQAVIYGDRMHEAVLMPEAGSFLQECSKRLIPVHIISHKTEHSNLLKRGTNFRTAALRWMKRHHFFTRLGLSLNQIHFTSTRQEKIQKIQQLGCTHFIDDLEEFFREESFPTGITKILYAPGKSSSPIRHDTVMPGSPIHCMKDWRKIYDYFFT